MREADRPLSSPKRPFRYPRHRLAATRSAGKSYPFAFCILQRLPVVSACAVRLKPFSRSLDVAGSRKGAVDRRSVRELSDEAARVALGH